MGGLLSQEHNVPVSTDYNNYNKFNYNYPTYQTTNHQRTVNIPTKQYDGESASVNSINRNSANVINQTNQERDCYRTKRGNNSVEQRTLSITPLSSTHGQCTYECRERYLRHLKLWGKITGTYLYADSFIFNDNFYCLVHDPINISTNSIGSLQGNISNKKREEVVNKVDTYKGTTQENHNTGSAKNLEGETVIKPTFPLSNKKNGDVNTLVRYKATTQENHNLGSGKYLEDETVIKTLFPVSNKKNEEVNKLDRYKATTQENHNLGSGNILEAETVIKPVFPLSNKKSEDINKLARYKETTQENHNLGSGKILEDGTVIQRIVPLPIIEKVFWEKETINWSDKSAFHICTYKLLTVHDKEYMQILRKIKKDLKKAPSLRYRRIKIKSVKVEQVQNPYLLYLYALKRKELEKVSTVSERSFFHGSSEQNVDVICRENLDFRCCERGKFGMGISFSKYFSYAFHYADKKSKEKIVLVCRVLVAKAHVGDNSTKIPMDGYDTTRKPNNEVYVKYDDDVFYPEYKITVQV